MIINISMLIIQTPKNNASYALSIFVSWKQELTRATAGGAHHEVRTIFGPQVRDCSCDDGGGRRHYTALHVQLELGRLGVRVHRALNRSRGWQLDRRHRVGADQKAPQTCSPGCSIGFVLLVTQVAVEIGKEIVIHTLIFV